MFANVRYNYNDYIKFKKLSSYIFVCFFLYPVFCYKIITYIISKRFLRSPPPPPSPDEALSSLIIVQNVIGADFYLCGYAYSLSSILFLSAKENGPNVVLATS